MFNIRNRAIAAATAAAIALTTVGVTSANAGYRYRSHRGGSIGRPGRPAIATTTTPTTTAVRLVTAMAVRTDTMVTETVQRPPPEAVAT